MILVKPSYIGCSESKTMRADVLFIGESPGETEAEKGRAFVGPAGGLLREIIRAELPGKKIVLDNCVPEYLGKNQKPDHGIRKKYTEYREESLKKHNPRVTVLLGEHALKSYGYTVKPVGSAGRVETHEGTTLVFSVHPAYVLRNMNHGLDLLKKVFTVIKSSLVRTRGKFRRLEGSEIGSWLGKHCSWISSVDIETSSLNPRTGRILTAAIRNKKETVWFEIENQKVLEDLKHWWPWGPRIVHNCKFEMAWLGDHPQVTDTMLLSWLDDETRAKGLDDLVLHVLKKPPYWLHLKDSMDNPTSIPIEELGEYNAWDAFYTWELYHILGKRLSREQMRLWTDLLAPLCRTLLNMEQRGLAVDRDQLARMIRSERRSVSILRKKVHKEFPGLNVQSPTQMAELCFKKLRVKPVAWTRTKNKETGKLNPSCDSEALIKMAEKEPRLKTLAEMRKKESRISRVLTPWEEASREDGRIHTKFNFVVTGRLSSSSPNLQNIARGGAERPVLVSRFPRGKIIQLDYKAHELRCYATIAGDKKFLEGFERERKTGKLYDPHQETADLVTRMGISCSRQIGKNVNFSVIYEISPEGLREKYGIPVEQGTELIPAFRKIHPEWKDFYQESLDHLERFGYVETLFGFRRHLLNPNNAHERRQAINSRVQGTAVQISFVAMNQIEDWLSHSKLQSILVLQIHDSIVIDAPASEVKKVTEGARKIMVNVDVKSWAGKRMKHPLYLDVEAKVGDHL